MFQLDPSLQQLPARPGQLLALAESSNQPHVQVPGRQAQAAQAFVVALRTSADSCAVYVYLWLTLSRAPAIFAHSTRRLPLGSLREAEDEAWQFCESMGFMIDRVSLDHGADQAELIARLPPFQPAGALAHAAPEATPTPGLLAPQPAFTPGPTPPPFTPGPAPAAAASPAELARLGRLLASF